MILRNKISENNNLFKVSGILNKVLLIFVFKRIPNYKNISNTNPFSLYYELCHTWNPDIFIIRGISEHWNIPKTFFLDLFRCLTAYWIALCICKYYVTSRVILGSVSGIFKHIKHYTRTYLDIYSEPSLSLAYSEPSHLKKFTGISIPVRHIAVFLKSSSCL